MKKNTYKICEAGTYNYKDVTGYAYYDAELDLHCFFYRKSSKHSWGLYDCITGLSLYAFGNTRDETIKAWQYVKESKNVTKELVQKLQNTFIERRNHAMMV